MNDTITLTGIVSTTPRSIVLMDGTAITSFRLSSLQKRSAADGTESEVTNWYTIVAYGLLARNVATSIDKGDRIIVTGELRLVEWESSSRSGTMAEVKAVAMGHDLAAGKSRFTRNPLV